MSDGEVSAYHYVGGLLLGAYPTPGSVPEQVRDERLVSIVEACIGVAVVDGAIDVVRVLDTLAASGKLDAVGGAAALHALIEDWSEREERAERLGILTAAARHLESRTRAEVVSGERLLQARERFEGAKREAADAWKLLTALIG